MTKRLEMYRCKICGNFVQVLLNGEGELVCCGEPMELLNPKTIDVMKEKHVPKFIRHDNGAISVRVGSELHPMTDEHYIMFIETVSSDKNKITIEYLYPLMSPEIFSNINDGTALEYCNIHGLWEGKNND